MCLDDHWQGRLKCPQALLGREGTAKEAAGKQDPFSLRTWRRVRAIDERTHSGRWGNSPEKLEKAASLKQVPSAQPVIHRLAQDNLARLPECPGNRTNVSLNPLVPGACQRMDTVWLPEGVEDGVTLSCEAISPTLDCCSSFIYFFSS